MPPLGAASRLASAFRAGWPQSNVRTQAGRRRRGGDAAGAARWEDDTPTRAAGSALWSQPHTKRQAATGSRIASGGPRLPGLLPLRQGRGRDTDVTGWSSPQALHSPGPGLVVPRFSPKPSHPQGLPRSGRWNCPIPGSPGTSSSGSGPPSLNMGEPSFGSKAPVTFQEATRAGSSARLSPIRGCPGEAPEPRDAAL